jgi:hypothetical protein
VSAEKECAYKHRENRNHVKNPTRNEEKRRGMQMALMICFSNRRRLNISEIIKDYKNEMLYKSDDRI